MTGARARDKKLMSGELRSAHYTSLINSAYSFIFQHVGFSVTPVGH